MNYRSHAGILALSIFALTACSNDEGSDQDLADYIPADVNGRFIDSAVSNLGYKSDSASGLSDELGQFGFTNGEMVTFSIGDVVIGSGYGRYTMTPLNLAGELGRDVTATSDHVTNIVRTLMIADEDENAVNGIQVSEEAHAALAGFAAVDFDQPTADFEADVIVNAMIARLVAAKTVTGALTYDQLSDVSDTAATAHLMSSVAQEAPIVVHSYPVPEEAGIPVGARIELTFAQPIDNSDLASKVLLSSDIGNTQVTVQTLGNRVMITPVNSLAANTRYTLTLLAGLATENIFGLGLDDDVSWTFETGAATLTGPLQVLDLETTVANSTLTSSFRVIDSANGQPVSDLNDTDFDVYENELKIFQYNHDERFKAFAADVAKVPEHHLYIAIDISDSISVADLTRFKTMAKELFLDSDGFSQLDDYQQVHLIPFDNTASVSISSIEPLVLEDEIDDASGDFILDSDIAVTDLFGVVNTFLSAVNNFEPYQASVLVIFSDGVESAWDLDWRSLEDNGLNDAVIYSVTTETDGDPDNWLDMLSDNKDGVVGLTTSTTPILEGIAEQLVYIQAVADSYLQIVYQTPVQDTTTPNVDFNLTVAAVGEDKEILGDTVQIDIVAPNQQGIEIKLVNNTTESKEIPLLVSPTGSLTLTAVTTNGPVPDSYTAVLRDGEASVTVDGDQITITGITAGVDFLTVNSSDGETLTSQAVTIANVYEWDFEEATEVGTGWEFIGDWTLTTSDAHSGSQSAISNPANVYYENDLLITNPDSALRSPLLDLTNYPANVDLFFSYKLKTNRVNTNVDELLVQYSTNAGTTWVTTENDTSYVGTWNDSVTATIPNTADYIRFAFITDGADTFEGVLIDKVSLAP